MEDKLSKIDEKRLTKAKNLGAKHIIVFEEGEEIKYLFLKEPDRTMYKMWTDLKDNDYMGANESVLKGLTIDAVSDTEIFNDYKAVLGAFNQLYEIMAVKKSELITL